MSHGGPKRRLTAILSAEVKEYSRLMIQHEVDAIRSHEACTAPTSDRNVGHGRGDAGRHPQR